MIKGRFEKRLELSNSVGEGSGIAEWELSKSEKNSSLNENFFRNFLRRKQKRTKGEEFVVRRGGSLGSWVEPKTMGRLQPSLNSVLRGEIRLKSLKREEFEKEMVRGLAWGSLKGWVGKEARKRFKGTRDPLEGWCERRERGMEPMEEFLGLIESERDFSFVLDRVEERVEVIEGV